MEHKHCRTPRDEQKRNKTLYDFYQGKIALTLDEIFNFQHFFDDGTREAFYHDFNVA